MIASGEFRRSLTEVRGSGSAAFRGVSPEGVRRETFAGTILLSLRVWGSPEPRQGAVAGRGAR
jgi:hypothetical protein